MKTRVIKVPAIKDELGLRVKPEIPYDYVVLEINEKEATIRLFGDEGIMKVKGKEVGKTYPRTPHRIIDKKGIITDSDDETEIGKKIEKVR